MLRILVCPLNWGLGHATRCRPIIQQLLQRGHDVHLAGDGLSLGVLKQYYPELPIHELAKLNINYGTNFWANLFTQIPPLFRWLVEDKIKLKKIDQDHHFDLILSDSRPGCRLKETTSVLLISQLSPRLPWFGCRPLIHRILWNRFKKFDRIWIPDQIGENTLSGELISLPSNISSQRIGFLSHLEKVETTEAEIKGKILAIVSGPEPLRTEFEIELLNKLNAENALIVGGNPGLKSKGPRYINYLPAPELRVEIMKAEYIICRAGYSTLMDLASYGKKLILVPTPGQSEQIYLAQQIQTRNQGVIWDIKNLNWQFIKNMADRVDPFFIKNDPTLLVTAIQDIENYCRKKINLQA